MRLGVIGAGRKRFTLSPLTATPISVTVNSLPELRNELRNIIRTNVAERYCLAKTVKSAANEIESRTEANGKGERKKISNQNGYQSNCV